MIRCPTSSVETITRSGPASPTDAHDRWKAGYLSTRHGRIPLGDSPDVHARRGRIGGTPVDAARVGVDTQTTMLERGERRASTRDRAVRPRASSRVRAPGLPCGETGNP